MKAAGYLDDADVEQIKDLGFSTFLEPKLGSICERQETCWFLKLVSLEENRIAVKTRQDVIFYITQEEIYHLLRLARGDKACLVYNNQQQKDFARLRDELGMDRDFKLSVKNILALMAKEDYKHLRVKCFFPHSHLKISNA
jgi:hypothetical protein